jgi:hypothetical protein
VVEGRKKDLINRGGEKISAEEVENLILMHPACSQRRLRADAGPDAMGEKMCAFVILRPGARRSRCRAGGVPEDQEIARFKLPERLEVLPDFPVSTFGKVSKKALGELVAAKLASLNRPEKNMRIIDLHCYPGTQTWIDAQGPYPAELATLLEARLGGQERGGRGRRIHRAGVEACLVALDLETTVATPPCTNEYVHGMWKRHPSASSSAGARWSRPRARSPCGR